MPKRKQPPKDSGREKSELVAPEPQRRPALFRALQTVRAALGAVIDLADAAADALTKRVQGRS